MPSFEVTTPDGVRYIIEGAPDQASALQAFRSQYQTGLSPNTVVTPGIPNRTFSEGVVRGMRDPIDAGAQALTHSLAGVGSMVANHVTQTARPFANYMTGEAARVDRINRLAEEQYEKAHPTTTAKIGRALGNALTTLPLFPAKAPVTLPRAIASGALQGAAMGTLQPVKNPEGNFLGKKLDQVIKGAEYGAPAAGVFGAAGRVISPNTAQDVQTLIKAGVRPTSGQILGGVTNRLEEGAQSIPLVGDVIKSARERSLQSFNRAAINKALEPIGAKLHPSTPIGREAITEAADHVENVYKDIVPHSGVVADATFTANFSNLLRNARYMPEERYNQFEKIIRGKVLNKFSPGGGMTGESFKEVESDLGRLGRNYAHSTDADQRQLGDALLEVQSELRNLLARSDPQIAKKLTAANEAYARLLRVQSAAASPSASGGLFTPAQLSSAVRSLDPTLRKNAYAKGKAVMQDFADAGRKVLGNKVPDTGTPYRVNIPLALAGFGVGAYSPSTALTLGGAALGGAGIYTKTGQALINPLLYSRPQIFSRLATGLRTLGPRGAAAYGVSPND